MKNLFVLFSLFGLVSCATITSPTIVSSAGELEFQQLETYEQRLFAYEYQGLGNIRLIISYLEEERQEMQFNRDYRGRVLGLLAYSYYLAGEKSNIPPLLVELEKVNPFEERLYLLKGLLASGDNEKIQTWEDGLEQSRNKGYLQLALALHRYDKGEFALASANFDQAFLLLPPRVEEKFKGQRDQAFQLRGARGVEGTQEYLSMERLTLIGLAAIVTQDGDWLRSLPQGASLEETVLIWKGEAYLLNNNSQLATRSQAAQFFYQLLVKHNKVRLGHYTNALAPGPGNFGARVESPVPDVPYGSPYFDAALVVVERQIMLLPDGIRFFPDQVLSGIEFRSYWENLKEQF